MRPFLLLNIFFTALHLASSSDETTPTFTDEVRFETNTSPEVTTTETITSTAFAGPLSTAAAASRQRLLQYLTHHFNKQQNIDQLPTHVMVKLLPIKIQDLNEKNEVLETTIRLQLTWKDSRLTWNPKSFYNVTELVVPGHLLWSPDVGILNSVSDIYHVVRDTRFEMKVENIGRVWWHPTGIVKTYCKLYLRYFPFDRQKCKLVLESPTLDVRFMNLTLRIGSNPVDTIMYMGGETWELVGVNGYNAINKVGSKTRFSRVEFVIHIQRAKIYHMLNVILPAMFLSMVQCMFFLLPATHPQRVGSSTTTLLSVVVFHSVAVSQLPKTSTDVPLLAIYIFIVTFISGLSVCTSIFVAKFAVYADQNYRMPPWLRRIPHPYHHAARFGRKLSHRSSLRQSSRSATASKTATPLHSSAAAVAAGYPPPFTLRNIPMVDDDVNSKYDNAEDEQMVQPEPPLQPQPAPTSEKLTTESAEKVTERLDKAFLFNNWSDVSYFVDFFLMLLAVTVAILSPFVMFVLIPALVDVLGEE